MQIQLITPVSNDEVLSSEDTEIVVNNVVLSGSNSIRIGAPM